MVLAPAALARMIPVMETPPVPVNNHQFSIHETKNSNGTEEGELP